MLQLAGCMLVKDIAIGAEGLRFQYRAGQIGRCVADDSASLRTNAKPRGPTSRYTLRRNTASMMKTDLDF